MRKQRLLVCTLILMCATFPGCGQQSETFSAIEARLSVHRAYQVQDIECREPQCQIVSVPGVLGVPEDTAVMEKPLYSLPKSGIVRVSIEERRSVRAGEPDVWVPLVFIARAAQIAIWPLFNDSTSRPGSVIAVVKINDKPVVSITSGTLPSPIECGEFQSPDAAMAVVASLGFPVATEMRSGNSRENSAAETRVSENLKEGGRFRIPSDDTLARLEEFNSRLKSGVEGPTSVAKELSEFLRDGDK